MRLKPRSQMDRRCRCIAVDDGDEQEDVVEVLGITLIRELRRATKGMSR